MATTVCLSQGVPIETVSQMLGHTSIHTTQMTTVKGITRLNSVPRPPFGAHFCMRPRMTGSR